MQLRGGAAMLAVMLLAVSAFAEPGGDALVRAKAAVDASDYLAARTALAEALAVGTNGPDQLAEIYKLTGVVTGALGDAKASQDAFTKCLLLAPGTALPVGTSPKIARPFDAAKAFTKSRQPVRIKTETTAEPKPAVTISVTSDPLSMIARFRVQAVVDGKPEQTLDRAASERSVVELPAGARIDLRVTALDDKGNRLVELGSADVPIVIVGKAAPVTPPPRPVIVKPTPVVTPRAHETQRPLLLRWWLWGGAAIVAGGAGAYFGVDALVKQGELKDLQDTSSNHSFDEALAKERATRRSILFANIGLISGGALALGATVLYIVRPRGDREHSRAVAVTPVVSGDGGGLVLGGRF